MGVETPNFFINHFWDDHHHIPNNSIERESKGGSGNASKPPPLVARTGINEKLPEQLMGKTTINKTVLGTRPGRPEPIPPTGASS